MPRRSRRSIRSNGSTIDCNWKRLQGIVGRIAGPLPPRVRIPDGFRTAYLRRNKQNLDPDGGLATIEALFIASACLGVWDETLLAEYPMAAGFLDLNKALFESHGLGPSGHHVVVEAGAGPAAPVTAAASATT